MRILSTMAVASLTALCFVGVACGGDDDPDADGTGGGAGSGGTGKGGSGGSSGDNSGGTGNDGSGGTGNAGTGGMAGGGGGAECDLSGEGLERVTIPAAIAEDTTLASGTVHVLSDYTYVEDGATLTIEPCTRVEGEGIGSLIVARGGKIMAEGTADEPILFTSAAAAGERGRGQWGGVILLGRAPNFKGADTLIEGPETAANDPRNFYGGTAGDDNSGVMKFVRIEFGGTELDAGNEINGLTLGSVGSGTVIENIMVNTTLDDCFEWFGGTVNGTNLICNNPGDDMFDADQGYTGTLENLFGRQGENLSSDPNGFEMDSDLANATPVTMVTASNVTLCGKTGGGATSRGMVLRENLTGGFSNVLVTGFDEGVDARDAFGTQEAPAVTLAESLFFGNTVVAAVEADADDDDSGFDEAAWVTAGTAAGEAGFSAEDCAAAAGPAVAVTGSGKGAFTDNATWAGGAWVSWTTE